MTTYAVVPAIDSAALARDEPVRDWSCARLAFSPRPMGGRDCRKRRALSGQLDGVVVGSVLPGRAYGPHPRALHASNAQRAGRSIVSGAATLATSGVPALLSSPPSLGAGRQLSSQSNGQPNSNLITTDMSARQRRRSLLVRAVAPPNRPLLTPGSGSRGHEPDDGDRFCGGIVARRQTLQDVPLGGATPTRLGLNRAKGPRL